MQARKMQMEGVARRNRKRRRQYGWKGSGMIEIYVNAVVINQENIEIHRELLLLTICL